MPQTVTPACRPTSKRFLVAQITGYLIALSLVVPAELERLRAVASDEGGLALWFVGINVDTTLYLLLLVLAPCCWCCRRELFRRPTRWSISLWAWLSSTTKPAPETRGWAGGRAWTLAMLVGATSLGVSASVAAMNVEGPRPAKFGDLPPAYHDEYSYLFQAKTFLAGRLYFPSHPEAARLFDQMHVLNEGRFASRFFPATGAWIAPFLAMGKPHWGHWLAGALTAVFVFWMGRELGGNGVGLLAGMLTALSPGMALFSNLLLSHHPTLVGLTLFIFTFLRMQRTGHWAYALLSGIGLSFAMLSRPMTAAGVGLPFGVWLFWWLARGAGFPAARGAGFPACQNRAAGWKACPTVLTAAVAVPVLFGLVLMFGYNRELTGSGWTTPYQLFTDIYTPRHVYGFNNVIRGEGRLGPKVLDNYDRWAENLTPALAARNVRNRLIASWQWTLGIVPLLLAAIVFLFHASLLERGWRLIAAAIVSLHAVHVPYWYDGIMHWHYVFESGPLWLLIFAGATQTLFAGWRASQRPWMPVWWTGVIVASLLTTYVAFDPLWPRSRLRTAVDNVAFSRIRYAAFQTLIDRHVTHRPALVLIEADPDDRHIDFVLNDPDLQADVLYGRFRPDDIGLPKILRLFPNRAIYLFRATRWQLVRVAAARTDR